MAHHYFFETCGMIELKYINKKSELLVGHCPRVKEIGQPL